MSAAWSLLLVALLSLLGASVTQAREAPPLRRFVVTVAADDGGVGRERLRYAADDARELALVMRELGGVASEDALSLVRPTAAALRAAFAGLAARVREASSQGARTEVLFYDSGHSDESALLLARDRVGYDELRDLLDALPADVRIAVLDSCASGAFTRLKGGVRRPAFVLDDATKVRGHAFLTSSSEDEAAQESDRIGGSFLTHYLVSGLRGAADESRDGKVSLTEVYRFAFDETLARTAQTQHGSQHPAYEIRLAGTGDLVMTDLRTTSAELRVDRELEGRLFVWNERGKLLIEVDKPRARALVLAVPPGRYAVELARDAVFYEGTAVATVGGVSRVGTSTLHEVPREATRARGLLQPLQLRPVALSLVPPYATNHPFARPARNHLDLALIYDAPRVVDGLQLALVGGAVRSHVDGVQLAGLFSGASALYGVQLSGAVNVARMLASGVQLTFAFNHAQSLVGVQAAAINWARDATGAQLGGVNLAYDVRGLQLGGLNVATGHVHGMQLGIVNYADSADVSLGLLALTRRGGVHAQLLVSDMFAPAIALRFDADYNYSFLNLGLAPYGRDDAYAIGAGLGAKLPVYAPYVWLDLNLGAHMLQRQWDYLRRLPNTLLQLRALARLALHRHLSLLLGPTLNVLVQHDAEHRVTPGISLRSVTKSFDDGDGRAVVWVGFAAGLLLRSFLLLQ